MILFYILAGLLTLLVAGLLARPLLRPMQSPPGASEHGQAVYRDQLQELERDVARGLVSPQEEAAARAEIGRRILAAERTNAASAGAAASPSRVLAGIVLLVPIAAVALYFVIGRPHTSDLPLQARLEAGETRGAECTPEMEAAIAELSALARSNPQDFEIQLNIGRVLSRCGRAVEALTHFENAVRLTDGGDNIDVLSEYAQARVVAADGFVDAEAFALFRQIIETDPENIEARLFLGLFMAQMQQYATARLVWEDLVADAPADAPWAAAIREQLATMPMENGPLPDAAGDPAAPAPAPDAPQ